MPGSLTPALFQYYRERILIHAEGRCEIRTIRGQAARTGGIVGTACYATGAGEGLILTAVWASVAIARRNRDGPQVFDMTISKEKIGSVRVPCGEITGVNAGWVAHTDARCTTCDIAAVMLVKQGDLTVVLFAAFNLRGSPGAGICISCCPVAVRIIRSVCHISIYPLDFYQKYGCRRSLQ